MVRYTKIKTRTNISTTRSQRQAILNTFRNTRFPNIWKNVFFSETVTRNDVLAFGFYRTFFGSQTYLSCYHSPSHFYRKAGKRVLGWKGSTSKWKHERLITHGLTMMSSHRYYGFSNIYKNVSKKKVKVFISTSFICVKIRCIFFPRTATKKFSRLNRSRLFRKY